MHGCYRGQQDPVGKDKGPAKNNSDFPPLIENDERNKSIYKSNLRADDALDKTITNFKTENALGDYNLQGSMVGNESRVN